MLAQRGKVTDLPTLARDGYLFDLKIDGVRCLAEVFDGDVILKSRKGADITARYPEITKALHRTGEPGRLLLDCEIAVCDPQGLPSWELTHKRDAQVRSIDRWSQHMPATLFVFDCLQHRGIDMRSRPFEKRRHHLETLVQEWNDPRINAVLHTGNADALWQVVCDHNLEGVVAKHAASGYRPGRSRDWVKVKRTHTATCLVGGFDPGEGSRAATFGALHLYLLDDKQSLVQVGKVGSGFSFSDLRRVASLLTKPPLMVEVEYLDVRSGVLRQPVFRGVRTDVEVADCTMKQLT